MGTYRILVTAEAVQIREPLTARLAELPVVLSDVDTDPADALIVGQYAEEDVRKGLKAGVRWIQSLATGVETVLIPEVVDGEVIVTNSSGATAGPVAEFAFARILEHAKGLRRVAEAQRTRAWDRFFHDSLEGSTMTVVGLGPIGQQVATLGRAFGMNVIGVRRRPEAGAGPCHEVMGPDRLPEAMARSDYVVLVAAVTQGSRGMIDRRALASAKAGCLIVNVGRAELVEHDALIEAAREGRIAAALDALPQEPLPPDDPLWDVPSISVSAHIATWTPLIISGVLEIVCENVQRFVEGRPLMNVVDKHLGYHPG